MKFIIEKSDLYWINTQGRIPEIKLGVTNSWEFQLAKNYNEPEEDWIRRRDAYIAKRPPSVLGQDGNVWRQGKEILDTIEIDSLESLWNISRHYGSVHIWTKYDCPEDIAFLTFNLSNDDCDA